MTTRTLPGRLGQVELDGELPRRDDLPKIFDELDYQLACQAYLWALPLVSYAQWQLVHRDVFGAGPTDLVHYVSYQDRLGLITANATTPYTLGFFDLAGGPLVIELPPGPTAGGLSDFWQREFAVLGEMGPEKGAGGRHVIVAPGQPAPETDARVSRSTGMNIMFGFRTLDPDPVRAQALVDAVRIYPYAQRDAPPPTRIVSPQGRPWSGDQPRGVAYWERLHEIYQREIVDERDRFYLAMLRQLGIEQGKPFEPGRAPDAHPRGCGRRRRADGAGQHVRQAHGRGEVLAGSPVGPGDPARQLEPAWPVLRRVARTRGVVLRGRELLRGDEEPDPRRRPGLPGRPTATRTANGSTAARTTRSTSPPTHPRSCSGRPPCTTSRAAA